MGEELPEADWLSSIPEVDVRLRAQPAARAADLACGTAWSSISIARAYPGVSVDALDVDSESIKTAHRNVTAAGAGRPCTPMVHDVSDPKLHTCPWQGERPEQAAEEGGVR